MNLIKIEPIFIALATLAWGISSDRSIASLLMACGIFLCAYMPYRLHSGVKALIRFNELSVVAAVLAGMWFWLDRQSLQTNFALHLLTLTPIFLYPKLLFHLGQHHGTKEFSSRDGNAIAKNWIETHLGFSRRSLDARRPLRVETIYYFVCIFISTYFFPWRIALASLLVLGLSYCLVFAWNLLEKPKRWLSVFSFALLTTLAVTQAGEWGIERTQEYLEQSLSKMWSRRGENMPNAESTDTSIGRRGKIDNGNKLIARIDWKIPQGYLRNGIFPYTSNGISWFAHEPAVSAKDTIIYPKEGSTFDLQSSRKIPDSKAPQEKSANPVVSLPQAKISLTFPKERMALPLPTGTREIFGLPFNKIEVNSFGIPTTYGSAGFTKFGIYFDEANDDMPAPEDSDLSVPEVLSRAIDAFLVETGPLESLSPDQAANAIQARFKKDWKYTLNLESSDGSSRSLTKFLLKDHQGHCEYFAAASTLALRRMGIPARYTTGFLVNEFDPSEKLFWVRTRDAHAWTTYWNGTSWARLDSTPGAPPDEMDWGSATTDWLLRLQYKIEDFDAAAFARQIDYRLLWICMAVLVAILAYRMNIKKKPKTVALSYANSLFLCNAIAWATETQRSANETSSDYWRRVAHKTNEPQKLIELAQRREAALFELLPDQSSALADCENSARKLAKTIKPKPKKNH